MFKELYKCQVIIIIMLIKFCGMSKDQNVHIQIYLNRRFMTFKYFLQVNFFTFHRFCYKLYRYLGPHGVFLAVVLLTITLSKYVLYIKLYIKDWRRYVIRLLVLNIPLSGERIYGDKGHQWG